MKTIWELRRERGWTQFDLALAVGVQPQTVYLWESGRRQPQVSQMRKLGKVFGICSDEIDLTPAKETYRTASRRGRASQTQEDSAANRSRVERAMYRLPDASGTPGDAADS
ncbi:MAG: helix-turn-helix transcriptional regulator [Thermomicrobiales bacterium]|nr:helix-turn-helix transcriptional regulator [Thermomicrobiales bacterium]